ncbi:MAG: bifunctional aspartate kinase/homoserine dehydrogenase I, partial [Treponema sp.]|nr:bifunctional aspartate kinase/homoserine dehydrogenase I [Treponema sp.]
RIIKIISDTSHAGNTAIVVVSALAGITDALISVSQHAAAGDEAYHEMLETIEKRHRDIASHFLKTAGRKEAVAEIKALTGEISAILKGISILGELSRRSMDLVMSFGERLSAALITRIFCSQGIDASYLDTRGLIVTNDHYNNADYLPDETYANIRNFFAKLPAKNKNSVHVTTGFIASTVQGHVSTLGRGGSDLTAAIFGAALKASEVQIWTDVDGILTADPKLVKTAFRIDEISYEEALEISHFGAKVLSPTSVKPALEQGIPIHILNTFNPQSRGTLILKKAAPSKYPIRGISSISKICLVRIQGTGMVGVSGFSARVFGALARRGINVILITQSSSEYSICFAVLPDDEQNAKTALKEEFAYEIKAGSIDKPVSEQDLSIIAVVGAKMKSTSGNSGKFFYSLGRNGINVIAIAQGSSELNISAVISHQDEAKALNAVHEAFFLAGLRSVNLFLVGTGNIGGTLLEQIAEHRQILADKDKVQINLIGAASIFGMVFSQEGLDPKKTKATLNNPSSGAPEFNLGGFIDTMISLNLPNACFCDCTANDEVASMYEKVIQAAIAVVTPNKRANSGTLDYYRRLTSYSRERGIPYLYETTVCAGLPVISTLRDLFISGDTLVRIEAVVSGTLSYIFNNFDGTKPFSALVREAKAKGYTEPDPRDDLNAMDAARKALILARECGMPLEFSNVKVEPILPQACFKAKDVEAFFKELEKSDADFEKRRAGAARKGMALRYVVVIENNSAKLSFREEKEGSPFRSLIDADNIVVITTDRYTKLPMVIKGPGAGAQVTAGGVFADIVRTARTLV